MVISVPVDVGFDTRLHKEHGISMQIGWLFGLVHWSIGSTKVKPKGEKKHKKRRPPLRVLTTKGLVSGFIKLVRRVLSRIHVRDLEAYLKIGLSDPADIGMFYTV